MLFYFFELICTGKIVGTADNYIVAEVQYREGEEEEEEQEDKVDYFKQHELIVTLRVWNEKLLVMICYEIVIMTSNLYLTILLGFRYF